MSMTRSLPFGNRNRPALCVASLVVALGLCTYPALGTQERPATQDRTSRAAERQAARALPAPTSQSAQQNAQSEKAAQGESSDQLLAGPRVNDLGARNGQQMPASMQAGPVNRTVPLRMWMRMLNSLELSDDQKVRIASIQSLFEQQQQEFQREHGETLRELRQQIASRQARANNNAAGADNRDSDSDVMNDNAVQDPLIRRRIAQIRSQAPQPERVQQAMWSVLTPAQQEQMRQRLAQFHQDRMDEMQAERVVQSRREMGDLMEPGQPQGRQAGPRETGGPQRDMDGPSAGERSVDPAARERGPARELPGPGTHPTDAHDRSGEPRTLDGPGANAGENSRRKAGSTEATRRPGPQVQGANLDEAARKRLEFLRQNQQGNPRSARAQRNNAG